jgi:hypothetical protein
MKYVLLLSLVAGPAFGAVQKEGKEDLVVHLARRVAINESERGLPSRAVWLGNRVAKNSKALAVRDAKRTLKNQKN